MNAPPFGGGSAAQQGMQAEEAAAEPDVHSGGAMASADMRDGAHGTHGAQAPDNTTSRASTSSRAAATLMQMSQEMPSSRRVIYDEVSQCTCGACTALLSACSGQTLSNTARP
jgi:hypothetical protein